jgi:hypothetical protein
MFRTSRDYSSAVYSVKPIDRLIIKQLCKKRNAADWRVAAAKLASMCCESYFISSSAASLAPYTFRKASIIARESTDTDRF